MKKNSKIIVILTIGYIILGVLLFFILKDIFNTLEIYYSFTIYIVMCLYIILGIMILLNKKNGYILTYLGIIWSFLFLRTSEVDYNFDFYLFDWIKIMFENKYIFVNIVGNIIIFLPLGIMFKKQLLYALSITIIFECLQYVFNKGIFDIVDIILNLFGVFIGYLGVLLWDKIKMKNKKMLT